MRNNADRGVECADRPLAARQGAALVAVEAVEAEELGERGLRIGFHLGDERQLGEAHAAQIDQRLGDPAGELVAGRIGLAAGHRLLDRARQTVDLARHRGIASHRQGQAVPPRIAGDDRLAGARPGSGAVARVAPVGADFCRAGHGLCGDLATNDVLYSFYRRNAALASRRSEIPRYPHPRLHPPHAQVGHRRLGCASRTAIR